jgi:hypothetical protein
MEHFKERNNPQKHMCGQQKERVPMENESYEEDKPF